MTHALGLTGATQQIQAALLVDVEMRADGRPEAAGPMATLAGVHVAVLASVEIGRGPAQIRDGALECASIGQPPDLLEHGIHAAAREKLALVKAEAAEGAATRAAA